MALDLALESCGDEKLKGRLTHCVECGIRFLADPRNAGRCDLRCPFGCRMRHRREQGNKRSREHYKKLEAKRRKKLLNARRSQGARSDTGHQEAPAVERSSAQEQQLRQQPAEDRPADEPLLDGRPSEERLADDLQAPPVEASAITGTRPTGARPRVQTSSACSGACSGPPAVWAPRLTRVARGSAPADPAERRWSDGARTVELRLGEIVLRESTIATSPMLRYVQMLVRAIDKVRLSIKRLIGLLQRAMRQRSMVLRPRTDYVLCFLHQHPP